MSNNDWGSVLLPMIRKVMPSVLAKEIIGVQPMTGSNGQVFDMTYTVPKSFRLVDHILDGLPPPPDGYLTVDVNWEVARWLKDQPIHMWKFCDVPAYSMSMKRYTISEKLYTMMALRWS